MMVRAIDTADDAALDAVLPLFAAMHDEMAAQGMHLRLATNGANIWLDGIRRGLERFGRLAVAERDGSVIGFAHASLKLAPEHLGGARLGTIAHLYVTPEHRRAGIARALAASLDEWLRAQKVDGIELQVVQGNEQGLAFWRSLGYQVELLQLRIP